MKGSSPFVSHPSLNLLFNSYQANHASCPEPKQMPNGSAWKIKKEGSTGRNTFADKGVLVRAKGE